MMTARDDDIIGTRPTRGPVAGLPLFESVTPAEAAREITNDFLEPPRTPPRTSASPAAGEPPKDRHPFLPASDDDRRAGITKIKEQVLPWLLERAAHHRDRPNMPGVTADDVAELAKPLAYCALLGSGQRAWSWVGPWLGQLERAGALVAYVRGGQVVYRRSVRPGSHGNLQAVYLDPRDARAQQGAA